jgi:hypothetical protein
MPRRNRIIAASVQDRDAARPLPWNPHRARRPIRLVWADAVYTGSRLAGWTATLKMTLCIVAKRDPHAQGRCRCVTLFPGRNPDHAPSSDLRAESAIGARLAVRDIPCGYPPW